MTTWWSADLHINHGNIIEYSNRPFDNVHAMNRALIDNWNAVVQPDDTVWVLGDVALGNLAKSLLWVRHFQGTKVLLAGNHDGCWDGKGKGYRQAAVDRYLDAGFAAVYPGGVIPLQVGPYKVLTCHFPYQGDSRSTERYPEHRPVDKGQWLLHGHVHDAWRQRNRMINVGVDAWRYSPVSEETLVTMIAAGPAQIGAREELS